MDDPYGSRDDAELERIAFGPGHSPAEVLAASAVLRERSAARAEAAAQAEARAQERARVDAQATAGGDAVPAESGHPPRSIAGPAESRDEGADAAPRPPTRRPALIVGALLLAALCTGGGYLLGAAQTPDGTDAEPPADRGTERSGDLGLYADGGDDGDPVAAAEPLFETAQDADDVLAAPVSTVDPASVRALVSTGNARFWIARDFDGGFCVVFARYRAGEVIGQEPFCATAEQFVESGNSVTLNGYRVDWTGGDVAVTVSRARR